MNKELQEKPITVKEFNKKLSSVLKTASEYQTHFKELMSSKPLAGAAVIFVAGLMSGVLVGAVRSRHH